MEHNSKIEFDEDMRLMLMAAQDDKAAYGKLYRKYFTIVTNYIMNLNGQCDSPEDLAQEVFVRVWQNRARYHPNATVKTFLFGYAKNVLHEKQSVVSRKVAVDISSCSNLTSNLSRSGVITQDDDIIKSIKKQIVKLPDSQRQTFEIVCISGYSIAKAAEILQCSSRSVYNNLYQARKKLRKLIT